MQIWAAELSVKLMILVVLVAHACDMDAALAWKSTLIKLIDTVLFTHSFESTRGQAHTFWT